jgi:hypothetical protein
MTEINYDDIYHHLLGFIDAITTKENVNKKDLENLIQKVERFIPINISSLLGEDDFPF